MKRLFVLALGSAWLASCGCGAPAKKCTTVAECDPGQICSMGECRAANTGGGGGNGGGGGGGAGAGGGGGGGTIVTGCDPMAFDNATRDTDCDGLSDLEEYNTPYANNAKTDPCNSDTDGDGVVDGVELGKTMSPSAACTGFVGDAQPNTKTIPTVPDTDGDGLSDGQEDADKNGRVDANETHPARMDTDCDGFSDKEEVDMAAGCATNPTLRDTDGDGLPDGVEGGLQPTGADPMVCTYTAGTFDSDPPVRTNACNADSDGDGIQDGAEDTNKNGKADMGELDPNNMGDGSGVAQQACATVNLRPINFHISGAPDVQIALVPSFSEISRLTDSTGERGFAFFDPTSKVGGIAISKTPQGNDATAEENNGRSRIGNTSAPLTQTFTTWDGFSGSVRAVYDVSGNQDVKARINTIAQNYLGMNAMGLLQGTAGATGPFKVVAEYVYRTNMRAVVVIAIVPANLYTGQALFQVDDAAGGTALAQVGDYANTQCEVFAATVNQKVDFLWVVDDSCSMASSQTAVANAGSLFGQKLGNAGLDWRAAAVTTGWYPNFYDGSIRDWTAIAATMTSWFSGSGAFGTGGSGDERGFSAVQAFVNRTGPQTAGVFRNDAQVHMIFLTDTHEQSGISPAAMNTYLANRFPGQRVVAHGVLCPEGTSCANEDPEDPVGKYHTLARSTGGVIGNIMVFNPANPTPAERTQQANTIDAILSAVIGGTGTQLQRPPISATIKVAVATTRGTCNAADVPRDRTNGWDIDPATRRIVFFGNCIPSAAGVQVAVSYKSWNDASPDPGGDPCGSTCVAPLVCDPNSRSCICPSDCGGCASGLTCNVPTCTCEPTIN
ncbi:MAG: hypothetical protein AB1938_07360 [Myxococcota bacterium]